MADVRRSRRARDRVQTLRLEEPPCERMKESLRQNGVREVWSGMTKAADKREAGQVAGWTEDAETESGFSASTHIRMAHL